MPRNTCSLLPGGRSLPVINMVLLAVSLGNIQWAVGSRPWGDMGQCGWVHATQMGTPGGLLHVSRALAAWQLTLSCSCPLTFPSWAGCQ